MQAKPDWETYCVESNLDHYSVTTQKMKDCAAAGHDWTKLTAETMQPTPFIKPGSELPLAVVGVAFLILAFGVASEIRKRRK